jgi:DNA replication protein DnaC
LELYNHIELTEDERDAAILEAKIRKERAIEHQLREERAAENRRKLTGSRWTVDQAADFARYRANMLFGAGFLIDENNRAAFDLLCLYFAEDQNFFRLAGEMQIQNPGLNKGILLCGNPGTGKTRIMTVFARNQRQSFGMYSAQKIANDFAKDGESIIEDFSEVFKNPINDAEAFFQPLRGICLDDIGSEELKNHFGNKRNVIGDIIERRYSNGVFGPLLHATTNFSAGELEKFFGLRVLSRMREIFNLVVLSGPDRRK